MRHVTFPGADASAGGPAPVGATVLHEWRRLAEAFAGDDRGRSIILAPYRGNADAIAIRADVARPGASVMKVPLVAMAERRRRAPGRTVGFALRNLRPRDRDQR